MTRLAFFDPRLRCPWEERWLSKGNSTVNTNTSKTVSTFLVNARRHLQAIGTLKNHDGVDWLGRHRRIVDGRFMLETNQISVRQRRAYWGARPFECSISARLPDGAPPPGRDPGAQTVAGRETKSKQDSYVRQHRMFPRATPSPSAIVMPGYPVPTANFSNGCLMTVQPRPLFQQP